MSNSNTNCKTQNTSVLQNVTVSSCSNSNIQEKTQLSRSRCMFLLETLQDYGTMPIFKRMFSQDLDLLEQHLTKDILSRTDCTTTLTDLRTKFENAFHSEFEERMQNYTRYDAQSFYHAMIFNMDSLRKYMLELILHQQRLHNSIRTNSTVQDDNSRSGNDTNVDNADIRPICDEELMAEVDSEPPHGSNVDIPHIHECKQTLDVSAGTSINVQKEQSLDLSAVSTEVHQAAATVTTSNKLDVLFGPLFDEYFNGENQVVLKSSAVTTTDASNKRQQQLD
ncbi:hypothetical protein Tco_0221925 [Tanacetum coccineum]